MVALSNSRVTSAIPAGGRLAPPPKTTSSLRRQRISRGFCSPMPQRMASTRIALAAAIGANEGNNSFR